MKKSILLTIVLLLVSCSTAEVENVGNDEIGKSFQKLLKAVTVKCQRI